MTNTDFGATGITGHQPEWFGIQGIDRDTLLQMMVDSAVKNETDLIIVPSMRNERIVRGSIHDNLAQLRAHGPALNRVLHYHDFQVRGSNDELFSIIRGGRRVSFLTAQVVKTSLPTTRDELDLLVVGANDFEPFRNPLEVCREARSRGLVVIPHQRFVLSSEGRKWLGENKGEYDAVVGHYALNCIPTEAAIGPLSRFDRARNIGCITIANFLNKSWVSASGAKRPEWTGKGHTYLAVNPLDDPSKLLADMGSYLRDHIVGQQSNYGGMGYVNPLSAVKWGLEFKKGLAMGLG